MTRGGPGGAAPQAGVSAVTPTSDPFDSPAPSLLRRLTCFLYEGVLLFGVVMAAGYLYASVTQQRHALKGLAGLQAFVFVVLGIYFTWFWSRGGQTLAMKTWRLRLVGVDGGAVSRRRAFARYLLSWVWFLPALGIAQLAHIRSTGAVTAAVLLGVLAYAALSCLRRDRQYWHDVACGTRIVSWDPALLPQGSVKLAR